MKRNKTVMQICLVGFMLVAVGLGVYLFIIPYLVPVKIEGIFTSYDYVIDGNEIGLLRYKGTEQEVQIPDSIMLRKVTSLKYDNEIGGVFCGNEALIKVMIPDSIIVVDGFAFSRCTNLKEVVMSQNVTEIHSQSFGRCKSLRSIMLPEGLEKIYSGAFTFCDALEKIELPSTVKEVGENAFNQCTSLKEVVIPDTVSQISGNSFLNTPWYEEQKEDYVVVGDGVLLKYNGVGEVVEIPEGVKYVGYGVFCNVKGKTEQYKKMNQEIILPVSMEVIGYMAFPSVDSAKTIIIKNDDMIFTEDSIYQSEQDDELTIVAREGSTGQKYAEENGITWIKLEE